MLNVFHLFLLSCKAQSGFQSVLEYISIQLTLRLWSSCRQQPLPETAVSQLSQGGSLLSPSYSHAWNFKLEFEAQPLLLGLLIYGVPSAA